MGCGISLGKKTVHPDEHDNIGECNGDVGNAKDKSTKDNTPARKGRRDSGLVKNNSNNPLNNSGKPIVERTQSQVEFFKMLDAKIEEGADYLSEED